MTENTSHLHLNQSDLIGEHSQSGLKIYKGELIHLPLLIPLIKEYYEEDPFCKAVGITVGDDHAWPLAYNSLRYGTCCFGVLNNEIVMLTLGLVEFKDSDDDKLPAANVLAGMKEDDPFLVLEELEQYFREFVFNKGNTDKCVLVDISYIRKGLRGKGLGNFSNACFNRLLLKSRPLGISRSYAVCTSKASLASFQRVGYEVIDYVPDGIYVDGNGNAFEAAEDGVKNAAIVRLDWGKAEEFDIYKDPDAVYRL